MPLTARKKKSNRMGAGAAKRFEAGKYGPEPVVKKDYTQLSKSEYIADLNWYSRFVENDDAWLDSFASDMEEEGYSAKDIRAAKRGIKFVGLWPLQISHMRFEREMILPEVTADKWTSKVKLAIEYGNKSADDFGQPAQVINLQDRTENKAKNLVEEIDLAIDLVWQGVVEDQDFKPFELFETLGIKPGHVNYIKGHYQKLVDDLKNNLEDDLKGLDKVEQKTMRMSYKESVDIYQKLITALQSWTQNKPAKERKPREKTLQKRVMTQAKKVEQAANEMKFQQNSDELGIVSVKSSSIVGAQQLVVYNTKYNVLTVYNASGPAGFTVKGQTIYGFDESKSVSKRAGRASKEIKALAGLSRTQVQKAVGAIKGTEIQVRARINEDTLLVKVNK